VCEVGRTGGAAAGAVITMAPSLQTAFLFGGTCISTKLPDKSFAVTTYVRLHERGSLLTTDPLCWCATISDGGCLQFSIRVSANLHNFVCMFPRYSVGGRSFLGSLEHHHSNRFCTKPGRDGPSIHCQHGGFSYTAADF